MIMFISIAVSEETETNAVKKHENEDGVIGNVDFQLGRTSDVVDEAVLMTITPGLGSETDE